MQTSDAGPAGSALMQPTSSDFKTRLRYIFQRARSYLDISSPVA